MAVLPLAHQREALLRRQTLILAWGRRGAHRLGRKARPARPGCAPGATSPARRGRSPPRRSARWRSAGSLRAAPGLARQQLLTSAIFSATVTSGKGSSSGSEKRFSVSTRRKTCESAPTFSPTSFGGLHSTRPRRRPEPPWRVNDCSPASSRARSARRSPSPAYIRAGGGAAARRRPGDRFIVAISWRGWRGSRLRDLMSSSRAAIATNSARRGIGGSSHVSR